MLAVTRALGDTAMKEFVIGLPYTQEVDLCEDDAFLILACDGVSILNILLLVVVQQLTYIFVIVM
jgi:protein phosphatase PTC1